MHVHHWTWPSEPSPPEARHADLVFAFGATAQIESPEAFAAIREACPTARVVGASTSGEIRGVAVTDDTLVVAALTFRRTRVDLAHLTFDREDDSHAVGQRLGAKVQPHDPDGRPLAHVFVLADGISLNGSAFARGLSSELPEGVAVTGGLAGDAGRFERTPLWADRPLAGAGALAVAFYGADFRVGVGAAGGWDVFGPTRAVTRSEGNVLAELDGKPALDLYKKYLGPLAEGLPASGLLFPLAVRMPGADYDLVRTLLAVDHQAGTITFAGDVPQGTTARLMRSNADRLIDGASEATARAAADLGVPSEFALLVSCSGRKRALGRRVGEEVEEAMTELGAAATLGFYSYGELSPGAHGARCELHNQTMTATVFAEV